MTGTMFPDGVWPLLLPVRKHAFFEFDVFGVGLPPDNRRFEVFALVHSPTGIVIMGTSGSGKSTLGSRLAAALSCQFVEGDALHPAANIAKMANGIPLDDNDRWPWLRQVATELDRLRDEGCVVSCSALKRSYRDFIRTSAGTPALFVYPKVDSATLHDRLTQRSNHYMPASLLDSQLSTFEAPEPYEAVLELDGNLPVETLVSAVMAHLITVGPASAFLQASQDVSQDACPDLNS